MQMLFTYLIARLNLAHRAEQGQTTVEYGLVLLLIALVVVGLLATGATDVVNTIVTKIKAKI